jgi:hypothetical protein
MTVAKVTRTFSGRYTLLPFGVNNPPHAGVKLMVGKGPTCHDRGEADMSLRSFVIAALIAAFPAVALAQDGDTTSTKRIDQRQGNQDRRIEKGARTGQLTGKEQQRLEKGQARIQRAEDKAMADGRMTKQERARIEHLQDQQSKAIYRERHDKQGAMKHDRQQQQRASARIDERQANQQRRIGEGVKSGDLTKQEAERLQKGQARIQKMEDKARADGRLTPEERRRIEQAQDRESERIYRERHDKQTAK